MTGLAASGPIAPRPRTAVPLVMTPTRLAAGGQRAGFTRIGDDFLAGEGDARRVGHRQIVLIGQLLDRGDRNLARLGMAVIVERGFAQLSWIHVASVLYRETISNCGTLYHARPCFQSPEIT
jgi:hypothetical protein